MYTIQYFIDKFSAISWYKWCKNVQINRFGQRCAFGHVTPAKGERGWYSSVGVPEMEALEEIGDKYLRTILVKRTDRVIAYINNGHDPRFQQYFIKDRVIAALKWAQQLEAQEIINSTISRSDCIVI